MSAPGAASHFDLVVIGGGSGGLAAAKEAAKINPNKKVLCLDYVAPSHRGTKWGLGGTCVNVGCIPKKLMHHAGLIGDSIHKESAEYGWSGLENAKHDWATMKHMTSDYIHMLNFTYGSGLRSAGVKYVEARAVFDGPNSLTHTTAAGKSAQVTFDRAIVSVGGRPTVPQIPGNQLGITSDDLFWLNSAPGKTLVVGAGYIALECAGFLHHIGMDTSVMVRGKVLRKMDQQAAEQVAELMERDGIKFYSGANPLSLRSTGSVAFPADSVVHSQLANYRSIEPDAKGNLRWVDAATGVCMTEHKKPAGLVTYGPAAPNSQIEVTYSTADGQQAKEIFDTVVFAIGRTPSTAQLNLPAAQVQTVASSGKILIDEYESTSNPRIFAIGDVAASVPRHALAAQFQAVDRPELTPVAIQTGQYLARRLWTANELAPSTPYDIRAPLHPSLMSYKHIATTIFSSPCEYAYVGLSEEEARSPVNAGGVGAENVEIYWSRFGALENSPLHPKLPAQRSENYTGVNLWSRRYALQNKLDWPEVSFEPSGMTAPVLFEAQPGQLVEAYVTEKNRAQDGTISYNIELNDKSPVANIHGSRLRLQPHVVSENAELFFKANCLAKLIVDKSRNELVVGLHFIGPNAGEVVQGFALALAMGATKSHFDRMVGIHPTAAEEFGVLTTRQSEGSTPLKPAGCGGGSCG